MFKNGAIYFRRKSVAMIGVLLLVGLFFLLPGPKAQAYFFAQELDPGDSGADVVALQETLRDLGFFKHPAITGYFGPITRSAVGAFQLARGLVPAGQPNFLGFGRVGPATRAELNEPRKLTTIVESTFGFNRDLAYGTTGEDVRTLQVWLNSNGYLLAKNGPGSPGNETAFFGPATTAALLKFQLDQGIVPTVGYFGPITRVKIEQLQSKPTTPLNLRTKVHKDDYIVISWDPVPNTEFYTLKRQRGQQDYVVIATNIIETTYIDKSIYRNAGSRDYSYIVIASNKNGQGTPSAEVGATVHIVGRGGGSSDPDPDLDDSPPADSTPPSAPVLVVATTTAASTSSLTITLPDEDETELFIYRATVSGEGDDGSLIYQGTPKESHDDTSLTAGTTYYYSAYLEDAANNRSAESNELMVTIVDDTMNALAIRPEEGSLIASWLPNPGASSYSLRYSTDEATWTEVEDIATTYKILTGLDYATSYYIQVQAIGRGNVSGWSSSETGKPLLDPEEDLTLLFDKSDDSFAHDYDDQSSLELQTFTIAWRFRQHELSTARILLGLQANLQSTGGWTRSGIWVRNDTDNKVDLFASVAGTWNTTSSSATYTETADDYIWILTKSGTSVKLEQYNPDDESLTTITEVTLSSATVSYNATAGDPKTVVNGALSGTAGITQASKATSRRLLVSSDSPTTDLKTALGRYLDQKYDTLSEPVEYFVDTGYRSAGTLSPVAVAPSKYIGNPILTPASTNSDGGIRWGSILYNSADATYHLWASVKKESDNSLRAYHATSLDGLTWSSEAEFSTPAANTIIDSAINVSGTIYILAEKVGSNNGSFLYSTSFAAPTTLTLVKTIDGAALGEGKSLYLLPDGRLALYYTTGHGDDLRSMGIFAALTTDPGGSWYNYGTLDGLEAGASTDQYYSFAPLLKHGDYVVGVGPRYNSTSETQDLALYVSRSDGTGYSDVDATWLNRGSSDTWDDSIIWDMEPLHRVGNDWRLYYNGFPDLHGSDPNVAKMGLATIGYRRLGSITGDGTWTSTTFRTSDSPSLTLNANVGSGLISVAVLDTSGTVLPGYDDTDFDSISGDTYDHTATWDEAGLPPYQNIKLRFTLEDNAVLYSYDVTED